MSDLNTNDNNNVIDLLTTSEFTDEHLEIVKNLMDWKNIYPELFGNGLPNEIVFDRFRLLPHDAVIYDQKYRAGGKSRASKMLEIQQNVERNGYKLKYPAAAWFEFAPGQYVVITGNSRGEIVKSSPFNIPNMIVAVYKASDPSYTKDQIEDAIDSCGLRFNAIHDPAEPVSKTDVKNTVTLMIKRYKDTNGTAGCAPTIDAITARVDYVCGEGVFQPTTRQNVILEIYNTFNPHDTVVSWSTSKTAAYYIKGFMDEIKWVNTDKVIYLVLSSGTVSQAFRKAFDLANKNPNKEIRIVLQTGTLDGYDLLGTYKNRLRVFIDLFNKMVADSIGRYADKTLDDTNISIYGALPALKSSHSITEGFYYNSKTETFYQKDSGVVMDVNDEDVDTDELLAAE
jgi:hypothetical protein